MTPGSVKLKRTVNDLIPRLCQSIVLANGITTRSGNAVPGLPPLTIAIDRIQVSAVATLFATVELTPDLHDPRRRKQDCIVATVVEWGCNWDSRRAAFQNF